MPVQRIQDSGWPFSPLSVQRETEKMGEKGREKEGKIPTGVFHSSVKLPPTGGACGLNLGRLPAHGNACLLGAPLPYLKTAYLKTYRAGRILMVQINRNWYIWHQYGTD